MLFRNYLIFTIISLISFSSLVHAKPVAEYFDGEQSFDSTTPTPHEVIGSSPGEWHYSPEQILYYMQTLAAASPRIELIKTGFSHEHRQLVLLAISDEDNIKNLEKLRNDHLAGEPAPVIVWQGYSIHGNESSGANAAVAYAWYLAAATDDMVKQQLKDSIVLIDPMMNPDGLSRAASWFNSHKGQQAVADPQSREHREGWPNGRTNHYWFDLNRDWLLQQHPESQARLGQFYRWRPHVLTDHHEMGKDQSYFFQPGVPSRQNPLTPEKNLELTRGLAKFHAKALDKAGQLYFSEESFDDYYYGKGSTYPDAVGTIGILFEQASSRGHNMKTPDGNRLFEDSIQNQITTSLSTLAGSLQLSDQLKTYQKPFFKVTGDSGEAWVISDDGRGGVLAQLTQFFNRHQIQYGWSDKKVTRNGLDFLPGHSLFVPKDQKQSLLVQALFERRTKFNDNTFYDVSTWNLPLSYDLPYASMRLAKTKLLKNNPLNLEQSHVDSKAIAWAIDWRQSAAPKLLNRLLSLGAKVRVSTKAVSLDTDHGDLKFPAGTLIIPTALQDELLSEVSELLTNSQVTVHNILTGLTSYGPDLGSGNMERLEDIHPAIIVGKGVNPYEAGEQWFFMDDKLGIEVSLIDQHSLNSINLDVYTHLIWVNGRYKIGESLSSQIEGWVKKGGTLILQQNAAKLMGSQLFKEKESEEKASKKKDAEEGAEQIVNNYADYDKLAATNVVGGALVEATVDPSHPLGWGQSDSLLPLFKKGVVVLPQRTSRFGQVIYYAKDDLLLSGYMSDEVVSLLEGSPALTADRHGDGLVVSFGFDPLFRAYMKGTERLLTNALFFSSTVRRTNLPKLKP